MDKNDSKYKPLPASIANSVGSLGELSVPLPSLGHSKK
jgi:hypothetical protein